MGDWYLMHKMQSGGWLALSIRYDETCIGHNTSCTVLDSTHLGLFSRKMWFIDGCIYLSTDLFQGCTRQVWLQHHEAVLPFSQVPHVSIGLPVVQGHRGQVVECRVQIVSHMGLTCGGGKVNMCGGWEGEQVWVGR